MPKVENEMLKGPCLPRHAPKMMLCVSETVGGSVFNNDSQPFSFYCVGDGWMCVCVCVSVYVCVSVCVSVCLSVCLYFCLSLVRAAA
jgi:hypothetical protein